MINLKNQTIGKFYYQGQQLQKIYTKGNLVYDLQQSTTPPPLGDNLFTGRTLSSELSYLLNGTAHRISIDSKNEFTEYVSEDYNSCNAMFENTPISFLNMTEFDTSTVNDMARMFNSCEKLAELNISTFDTSRVRSMSAMFCNCKSLATLSVTNFNTNSVISMQKMFSGCENLHDFYGVSNFNTNIVTNMQGMFQNCKTLDVFISPNFDMVMVVDASYMFEGCSNVSRIVLSSATPPAYADLSYMFANCFNLQELDIRNLRYDYQMTCDNMFSGTPKLNHIICTKEFQKFCQDNPSRVGLPERLQSGDSGWTTTD